MKVEKFKIAHYYELMLYDGVEDSNFPIENVKRLEGFETYTFYCENGSIAMVGGMVPFWNGRGEIWAIFNPKIGHKDFYKVFKKVKAWLHNHPFQRIEATLECDYETGHRWHRALGFKLENPRMEEYKDGQAHSMYVLVKRGDK